MTDREFPAGAYAERHPYEKSFEYYIGCGYRLASGTDLSGDLAASVSDVAKRIDASILIIDDIIDGSLDRAGRESLFRTVGVKGALVEAIIAHCDAVSDFRRAMLRAGVSDARQLEILDRVNELMHCIYHGQRMDLAARARLSVPQDMIPALIEEYFHLLLFATSSHVRIGLEVGQLLAARAVNPQVSIAADAIGIIRQMCDDVADYFDDHHQPFGDFIGHLNRLPELLFLQDGGDRQDVMDALDAGRFDDARELVLAPMVRKRIHWYCQQQREKVGTDDAGTFDLTVLIEDYDRVLSR